MARPGVGVRERKWALPRSGIPTLRRTTLVVTLGGAQYTVNPFDPVFTLTGGRVLM